MNLAVTGATSFLGTALIRELLRRGHQVYAVARPDSKNLAALTDGAKELGEENRGRLRILESELGELDHISRKIKEPCEIFFHFGWDGSGSQNRMKADVQQKNVADSVKALRGARSLGCRRFVFGGSQAEYGVCQTAMREDMDCHPVSEYGKAKREFGRQAREICGRWAARDGFRMEYIHARIFSVYGPGDHPWSLVNTCLDTFVKGGRMELGACDQQWNYLYIEDLARGLLALAFSEKPVSEDGVYNLAGDRESTRPLREYVETMRRLCGGRGSCAYDRLPPNAEGAANLMPDIGKMQERTGWKPQISFEEGIRRMLEIKNRNRGHENPGLGRRRCILCKGALEGEGLMELRGMPSSAQDIPDEVQVKEDRGITLRLHQCPNCGLVQFDCEPVGYYRDVIRSGGYSSTMVNLRSGQYRHLIDAYHLEGKKFLEVGCGRGEFLNVLTQFPVEAYGVEHSQALVDAAVEAGLCVTRGFAETPEMVLGEDGPYDAFLSFNFLEHQPEPGVMLDCIKNNLKEEGVGLITVPSLEYILRYNGYYELLRDHVAYYTFDTLRCLLESHGFEVLEEELVNRDTLSVIVRLRAPGGGCGGEEGAKRRNAESPQTGRREIKPVDISGLTASLGDIGGQMEELCARLREEGKSLAIWGAGHQGFTLAATTVLKEHARYIMDSAPFKQGRFAPASHLPIVAPDHWQGEPADVVLIAAPGYTQEIAGEIRRRFGTGVEILTMRSDKLEELS